MKKIGIYVMSPFPWDETCYENGGIGGSEVWAIKTADEFAKRGYSVYLFAWPYEIHTSSSGVRYLTFTDYKFISENFDFDYFIFSRIVPDNINDVKCKNIYFMAHDLVLFNVPYGLEKNENIKGIFYLSEYHKKTLMAKYPTFDESKFFYTKNGVDWFLYEKYNNLPKKNKMICSSGPYRQGLWLAKYVFPKIRKEVPDFEMNLCHYMDNFDDEIFYQDGINIIGTPQNQITKDELIREQCESKIWVYANHCLWFRNLYGSEFFNETFCITAIENACAKSALIVGEKSPFTETLKGYNHLICKNLYTDNILDGMPLENLEEFAQALADEAIKCLKDENYRLQLVNSSYNIGINSSWQKATDYIENEILKN